MIINLSTGGYTPPATPGFHFIGGNITTNGLLLPSSGGTATALTHYETGTLTTDWSGAIPATGGNISFTRIGNIVVLRVPVFAATATSSGTISNGNALFSRLRPTTSTAFIYQARNGASPIVAHGIVDSSGFITLYAGMSGSNTFTNGNFCGLFNSFTITYTLT
jgi:hypothetical protein